MERIQAALMQWGEAMQVGMENRSMFYSPLLKHWRVKKWAGKDAKSFLYDGDDFKTAFETLLGPHAAETMLPDSDPSKEDPIQPRVDDHKGCP
jgi:hypothetical protein